MFSYLIDSAGALQGPVEFPVIPGLGDSLPSNAIQLAKPLSAPPTGFAWALVGSKPKQIVDRRGLVYSTVDGSEQQHLDLGELPAGLTATPRPSPAHHWQSGEWVADIGRVYDVKVAEVNKACAVAITKGFWSSALGEPHQYTSEFSDQLNLTGMILRGIDGPYVSRDEQGMRDFRLHTVAQLRQVGDDLTDYKLKMLQQANRLKQQLDEALAAGDLATLQAMTWADPQ